MSTGVPDRRIRSRASEEAALRALVERLARQFPELAPDEIDRAVHGRYAEFESSRVRDFVPVLVERAARRELGATQVGRHRA